MTTSGFPDAPLRPGSPLPPATIANVKHLLDRANVVCRYNVIKKKVEIELPNHRGTLDNRDNVTMTAVIDLATQSGMPHGLIPEYVNAIADRNAYNPVADWIISREWDGVNRFPDFASTITIHADYDSDLRDTLLRKWTRSAAAAAIRPNYKGRGVLTFQGRQGSGKTSWVKSLVNDPILRDSVIKLDHHLDASNKDSITSAISNWIVEIGELDSSFKRDVARLKGFLTADFDRIRRPYDRRESEYPRRTVFIATVNDGSFLVDRTGNTRWWTIAVESLDFRHSIDMQQVFAQAAQEVREGASWVLDASEEAQLETWNARHLTQSVIADQLDDYIDHDCIGADNLPALTASQALELIGIKSPTNAQAKECGAALRNLLGEPKRIQGRMCWRVPIRRADGSDLKTNIVGIRLKESVETGQNGCAPGEIF